MTCPCCKIISEQRVRLADIDAEELNGSHTAAAQAAKQYLAGIIEGKAIELQVVRAWPDKYGRVLARVYYRGEDIGIRMMAAGHAKVYHSRGVIIV